MNKGLSALLTFAFLLAPASANAEEQFSSASAMRHVTALAETIGPRKTGTPGERAALDYIADTMREAGLEVRRLAVPRVGTTMVGSENVIGTLKGRLPDAILISSHQDSRSTTIPGANDDASAVGVMLEVARVMASSESRPAHTLVFASFCAEEEGLLGARHYAQTQDLSSLRLVINMDPVGQREIFISPFPTAPPLWANRALAEVASRWRIAGVIHDPLYLLVTRSMHIPFGADHEPFLEKGIQALSISDRFRMWTYHTSEDKARWIDQGALDAAGRSVLALVRWFDEQPPQPGTTDDRSYVVLPIPGHPVFVVTGAIYALAAVLLVLAALWWRAVWWKHARRGGRVTWQDAELALWRAAMPLAGVVLGALLSEALSQAITGYRFSWWSRQEMHLAQAAAFSLAGLGAGMLAASKRRGPADRETFMVLSVGISSAMAVVCLIASRPDLAFYFLLPAATTLGAALIAPALAGLGTLLGFLPLLTLVTPSSYADAVAFLDLSIPAWITAPAIMILALPMSLGLCRTLDLAPVDGARRRVVKAAILAGAAAGVALLVVNVTGASYDETHRRVIQVRELIDLEAPGRDVATLKLFSGEYLRQVTTSLPGAPMIDERATFHEVKVNLPAALRDAPPPGVSVVRSEASSDPDVKDVVVSTSPPSGVDRARITLRSTEPLRVLDDGVWMTKTEVTRRTVHQMDAPSETFRIAGRTGQTVEVEVSLEMAEDVLNVRLSAPWTVFRWNATISWRGSVVL